MSLAKRILNSSAALCFVIGLLLSSQSLSQAQQRNTDIAGALRYRYIGPVGNRLTSVVGLPGQPNIYFVGAASGGIFKTTDGGVHWEPIFDEQPVSSIGSLAIAPSDPNIVWAGTGEAWIRSHISVGQGIYKSTDAGKTWTLMGLEKSGRIGRIVIDPRNPDIVLAAALGHAYGPQQERGVFRTTDGGKTWERVLFTDENTGCSDLVMDPSNPRILFAGMWPLVIRTWGRESGGPGSGLFKSTDGGVTWKKLTGRGLPSRTTGKFALAIARSNPNRIYALIETGDGVPLNGKETDRGKMWRSDDGGDTWRLMSYDRNMGGRTHYYFRTEVSPDNPNETYYLTAGFAVSLDGGDWLHLPAVPEATITTSGSIPQTPTVWRSRTMAACRFPLTAAGRGIAYSFPLRRCITSRWTIVFLITFTGTNRTIRLIVDQAAPVVEVSAAGRYLEVRGTLSQEAKAVGPLPIQLTRISSGRALPAPAVSAA